MKKILIVGFIALAFAGYHFDKKNKLTKKAEMICEEHFKTTDERCIEKYWNYAFHVSSDLAEKKWPEYKKQVNEIEREIDNLNSIKKDFDPLSYSIVSYQDVNSGRIRGGLPKKIVISGGDTKDEFFDAFCRGTNEYYVCMKTKAYDYNNDQEISDSLEIGITNINDFPEVKEIIDKLSSYNFSYYKITVFGEFIRNEVFNPEIKADHIKLERVKVEDRTYESSLSSGLYRIKRDEFIEYYKKKFPNEKTIPQLNLSLYKD